MILAVLLDILIFEREKLHMSGIIEFLLPAASIILVFCVFQCVCCSES